MNPGEEHGDKSTQKIRILIVDDDEHIRDILLTRLQNEGYACEAVPGGEQAMLALQQASFSIALVDLEMPGMDGFQVLAGIQRDYPDTIPMILTGRGDIPRAVRAMRLGAFDFLEKPCNPVLLGNAVRRAAEFSATRQHARRMEVAAGQWQSTFDASPDVLVVTDHDGLILRCNNATACLATSTPDLLSGRSIHDVLCAGLHDKGTCPFAPQFDSYTSDPVELRLSERTFELRIFPLNLRTGKPTGWFFVARDITLRRQAEAALRSSEEKFRQIINNMALGVLLVDANMRVLDANKIMREWWPGIESEDKPMCYDALPCPGRESPCEHCPVIDTLRDGEVHENLVQLPVSGDARVFRVISSPIHDRDGRVIASIATYGDITEKLRVERELNRAQRLEAVGQLAAGIAHEINTPMQYVGDNIEFLQAAYESMAQAMTRLRKLMNAVPEETSVPQILAEIRGLLEEMNADYLAEQIPRAIAQSLEGVERVTSIVKSMKEFSHPGTMEKTFVDLNHCISSTVTVSRNEWKYVAELETDLDAELPLVCCSPGELNQVFLNLIVNAAHAISDVVGQGDNGKGKIVISSRGDGDWVEIRVSDTGTGMPEKIRDRIFDPFFTTKDIGRGTGQGLSIARNVIVGKHGGTLTVDTEVGKGTTFTIRLPIGGQDQPESYDSGEEKASQEKDNDV